VVVVVVPVIILMTGIPKIAKMAPVITFVIGMEAVQLLAMQRRPIDRQSDGEHTHARAPSQCLCPVHLPHLRMVCRLVLWLQQRLHTNR